jgi:hypothetical protein
MYLEIDVSTMPPEVVLKEPDDFKRFDIVIPNVENAYVSPEELRRLAGRRAEDEEWRQGLEQMISFAKSHGWVADDGSIQAHIKRET